MKLIRALGITIELLSKRRVTATELAARFEVSIRTIYRDIEMINQAGIPVVSFSGTDGGFEVMDGFYLTKQLFSLHDLSVIYCLLKGMDDIMSPQPALIMNKLASLQPALLQGEHANKLIVDLAATHDGKDLVQPLLKAIHDRKRVSFTYSDSGGNVTVRNVEPENLYWGNYAWYLNGYCLLRQASRMFRLTRISEFVMTTFDFDPRQPASTDDDSLVLGIEIHLCFDQIVRRRVLEQFPEAWTEKDGFVDVHTVVYTMEYAITLVLSYGTHVTVVSPDALREKVKETAQQIAGKYG